MRNQLLTVATLIGALAVVGCGLQSGHTEMTYNTLSSQSPGMNTVHEAGKYALYPSDGTNPITTKDLQSGDQYGFTKDDQGKVVGAVVIGGQQQQIPLTAKLATAYYWKKQ